ncbi:MAG: NAD(P)-dependent oxidoreductase [Bacteroidales bacterium]
MKPKVLFMDTVHPVLPEQLVRMGFECDYYTSLSRTDYLSIIQEYTGLIVRGKIQLNREMLEKARNLKFIGRVGAGMEAIDREFAESRGIHCLNAPEGNRDAVAEHALGMLLALFNKLKRVDTEVRSGIWKRESNRGVEIKGKTTAIIGFGNMGSAFAQRLKGFETRIIAYDKYKSGFGNDFVEEVSMDEVFKEADILSLHVPLSRETQYLVNNEYFKLFHKNIYLINTSRGSVVNTSDLVTALQCGKVKGALLDVLEYEGLSFESLSLNGLAEDFKYLSQSENVLFSPHIAGWTVESHKKLAEVIVEKIRKIYL